MNKILITVDENDTKLGSFFYKCREYAESTLNNDTSIDITTLNSSRLKNSVFINMEIEKLNKNPFILLSFSHGNENELLAEDNCYISTNESLKQFTDSFIYNFACLTGVSLGKKLVKEGAKCFVGHNKQIYAQQRKNLQDDFTKPVFCFMDSFFKGENISTCIEKTKELYNQEIDEYYGTSMLLASALMDNRDSLVCYGSDSCTIHDFESAS